MRFYNIKETAEMLKISEVFLRKLIAKGKVPAVRIGRRILLTDAIINEIGNFKKQGESS